MCRIDYANDISYDKLDVKKISVKSCSRMEISVKNPYTKDFSHARFVSAHT